MKFKIYSSEKALGGVILTIRSERKYRVPEEGPFDERAPRNVSTQLERYKKLIKNYRNKPHTVAYVEFEYHIGDKELNPRKRLTRKELERKLYYYILNVSNYEIHEYTEEKERKFFIGEVPEIKNLNLNFKEDDTERLEDMCNMNDLGGRTKNNVFWFLYILYQEGELEI